MVTRIWDTALNTNTLNSYTDAAALMKQQRIPPIVGGEAAANMLDQWLVMVVFLLVHQERQPAVFEIATLIEAADEVNSRLLAQAAVQQDMPVSLVRLVQTKFNESFRQVFTSHLPLRWTHFIPLIPTLTTGHFHPDTVTVLGDFLPSIPVALIPQRTIAPPLKTSAPVHQGGDTSTRTT